MLAKKLGIDSLLGRSDFCAIQWRKAGLWAVASVYAFAPSVIVMDEPSANLDPMATKKLREIIQALRSDGFTVVISEHRTHYIIDLVDRALLIQDGKLVREYQKSAFQSLTNAEANAMGLRSFYLDELQVPKHPLTKLNTVGAGTRTSNGWLHCAASSHSKFKSQGLPRGDSGYCWTQRCW